MNRIVIKNAKIVNENIIFEGDLLIENEIIIKIDKNIFTENAIVIDAKGNYLLPGMIDDQVHFREPGLTHKGNIATESKAAVAGGITSFIEQPNTIPNATTHQILEQKYDIARQTSFCNYSFMLGGTNNNLEEIKKTNPKNIAGIKLFLGSSTGNMLVDDKQALEQIFLHSPTVIATHCEDEKTIKNNTEKYLQEFGNQLDATFHDKIRSADACFISSSYTVDLAKKTNAKLHVFHLSTGIETSLFSNKIPLKDKKITAEVCVHHLWFSNEDYATKGNFIKWNPAIKTPQDRNKLWDALLDDTIDVIATDHAPHTLEEKNKPYIDAPSGGPLVQHALVAMLEKYKDGKISLEKIAEKTAHNVATIFQIEKRGFIKEGFYADLVLVNINQPWKVTKNNILYHCGWSPFEDQVFQSQILCTFVNGNLIYNQGEFNTTKKGKRLIFDRC
jgi:dihydroorotase